MPHDNFFSCVDLPEVTTIFCGFDRPLFGCFYAKNKESFKHSWNLIILPHKPYNVVKYHIYNPVYKSSFSGRKTVYPYKAATMYKNYYSHFAIEKF